jgi:hypothetical protein
LLSQLLGLCFVDPTVVVQIASLQDALHLFGQLALVDLAVLVGVMAHQTLDHPTRTRPATGATATTWTAHTGTSHAWATHAWATHAWTALTRRTFGPQFVSREFAVAVLIQLLQRGSGVLDLFRRNLAVPIRVQRHHQRHRTKLALWATRSASSSCSPTALGRALSASRRLSPHCAHEQGNCQN